MNHLKKPQNLRTRCQSAIEVKKITTRLSSRNPNISKKHCPQDQACFHCCQCWIKFKQEYNKRIKFFETKVDNDHKENSMLKNCIQKLTKENIQLRRKVKNTTDFQAIKENLRLQLKKQNDEEIKTNDLIQRQKIASLKQKLKKQEHTFEEMIQQVSELSEKIKEQAQELHKKQAQCENYKQQLKEQVINIQKEQLRNLQLTQQIQTLNNQVQTLRSALKQKDVNLSQLKSTIDHTDRLISIKSTQLAQKDFQKTKFQLQSTYKSQVLQKMQKVNQQNTRSISQLQTTKSKLNMLVGSLKDQILATDAHKNILKIALGDAQNIAMEKSLNFENLKFDVRMLKYTLPQSLNFNRVFLED